MSDVAIRVEKLGKIYRIGAAEKAPNGKVAGLKRMAGAPFAYLRRMSKPPTEEETLWALKDVSFEVKRGEVLGVIGRNGAGKSTLLKILSRITEPTVGRAEIHGRVGSLLEVGTGFHPELTGRENIYMSGTILGMRKVEIDRQFDEIVDFSGIGKFLDTPVKRYSSGMNVRLGFAVAAHLNPEILLVDEVLAVGDAAFQKKCIGKMSESASVGRTVLFVSHNLAAVQKICPKAVLIDSGLIRAIGDSTEIVKIYLDANSDHLESMDGAGIRYGVLNSQKNQIVRIEKLELLNQDGELINSWGLREGLRIRIHYEAYRKILVPGFIVMVRTHDGVELCRVSNMPISGYFIESISGKGMVEVIFDQIPFTGGRYYISIGIARAQVEWLARYDDVAWFDVEPRDAYNSGLAMNSDRGYLILKHQWHHTP